VRELCAEAGFSGVRRVPLDDPFNSLYEIRGLAPDRAAPSRAANHFFSGD
jgi:hypothetical protein